MYNISFSANQSQSIHEGYGYSIDCLWEHIGSSGLPIFFDKMVPPSEIGMLQKSIPGFGYFKKVNSAGDIVINISTPEAFVKSNTYSVGFTFWETNKLPIDWVEQCNEMDEIWTCSVAMKDVFINSGVIKPVHEFKLGVDPKIYFPKKRTPHNKFTFISIGSPSTRKNSQMSVDAFLKLFEGNHDYKLIYKSNGPGDARLHKGTSNQSSINYHPQIEVIDYQVSHEELAAIYDKADCLLYPTSGEGWGLIPFQAIAKGIPTICTNVLACTEFAEMSVPLDFVWGNKNMSGLYSNAGEWAEPNFDDLCDKMLYVVNNYQEISDKTYKSAEFINQNMTWEYVSKKYIDRIKLILDQTK